MKLSIYNLILDKKKHLKNRKKFDYNKHLLQYKKIIDYQFKKV